MQKSAVGKIFLNLKEKKKKGVATSCAYTFGAHTGNCILVMLQSYLGGTRIKQGESREITTLNSCFLS